MGDHRPSRPARRVGPLPVRIPETGSCHLQSYDLRMAFLGLHRWRRKRLRVRPLAPQWQAIIERNVPYVRLLSPQERAQMKLIGTAAPTRSGASQASMEKLEEGFKLGL